MVILNIDHPDIVDFIDCKSKEEAKAHALVRRATTAAHPDSDAYSSIFFQNANNSVRVTDDFMVAVMRDTDFSTARVDGRVPVNTYKAKDPVAKISEATWHCGDPGMQYDTTVNRWHTSKNTARINASNPCSEYMFLDDSACNLASLNLLKFAPNGTFDVEAYRHAVDITITAQEILVDNAAIPPKHRQELARLSSAGTRLCQPGRAADGRRPALRLRCGPRLRRLCNCHHVRRGLSAVVEDRRALPAADSGTDTVQNRLGVTTAEAMPGAACPGWYINREPSSTSSECTARCQQHQPQ
jgi:ribonucleoside-diphosphate reductase alpha chain